MKNICEPTEYKPTAPKDFIGPARKLTRILEALVKRTAHKGSPVKVLIRGDSGIGKSALLDFLQTQLGVSKWSLTKINGTELKMETLSDWSRSITLTDMFGGYRVLRIEEIDKANATLQARMLTLLDDLPANAAVICTSNKEVEDFEPRFQSRFQVFSLEAPKPAEIKKLLCRWSLRPDVINRITHFACGNVRLALFDAQSALDEITAQQKGN